jgi:hypothetical protein
MVMKRLRAFFWESFGISLSRVVALPNEELFCLAENGLLYGSATAKQKIFLAQSYINDFIASDDVGYFLIGYWGHGINSYAFYYSRIDEWSHIFFRLAYGGVYMDNAEAARYVREFLSNYFAFEPVLKLKAKSLTAIDSMGDGDYSITLYDGRLVSLKESLYRNADFSGKFNDLLQR